MENMCGIKMFSAQDICKGLHVTKETAYAIMKSKRRCYSEKSINFFIFTYLNSYALILSGELVW